MRSEIEIAASLMCCNPLMLGEEISQLTQAGCDSFHVDIMDGFFVKNFAMSIRDISYIRCVTCLPINIHLMIQQPSQYFASLVAAGADRLIIHPESTRDYLADLRTIHLLGAKAGIALSPKTSLNCLDAQAQGLIDRVLVMAVNPGFAGQPYIPETPHRINHIQGILSRHSAKHIRIEVDGAVSKETVPALYEFGARQFVGGSSGLFLQGVEYAQAIRELKSSVLCSMAG